MVAVTEVAKQELKKILETSTNDPEVCIRLRLDPPGQLGLVLDKEAEGDEIVEHEGVKVMLVATELNSALEGIKLDIEDTTEGRKLVARKTDS